MMMPCNKQFTNRITRSVLNIRSPHFYVRPSQAQAVRKRLGFVFSSNPVSESLIQPVFMKIRPLDGGRISIGRRLDVNQPYTYFQ